MTKKNIFIVSILAVLIAFILWVTLFSRIGSYTREFYPPFSSYKAILSGSSNALYENICNIILFVPIGMAVALFFRIDIKSSLIIGFILSLGIECCQWFFWLGSFEIDDLIHNTIGSGLGAALLSRTTIWEKLKLENCKKSFIALLILIAIISFSAIGYQGLKWQKMKSLAAMNDRDDGTKNLLVLSPDPIYMGETNIDITYNPDGSIFIEGTSENRAWIQIGTLKLTAGKYVLTGLSNTKKNTIALVLDTYKPEEGKYRRITEEISTTSETVFEIEGEKVVRALISIYPDGPYSVIARPAVFRED